MNKPSGHVIDITGHRYGRVEVLSFSHSNGSSAYWLCVCQCGKQFTTQGRNLRCGATQSCGCLGIERRAIATRKAKTIHGETSGKVNSRTYRIWNNMRSRCQNPKFDAYPFYGGRGIAVCDRWNTFANFLVDMGRAPEGLTLDRIDPNGNYEPSNCRWASVTEQQNNRRSSKRIAHDGRVQTQAQWARELGLDEKLISARLIRGWSVERAFGLVSA